MIVLVDNILNAYDDPILLYIHYCMYISHKILKFEILSIKHQTIPEYLTSLNVSGDYIHGLAGPKSFRYIVWKGKRYGPTFCANPEKLNDLFNKQEDEELDEEFRSYSTSTDSSDESMEFNNSIIPVLFTDEADKIRFLKLWKILNIAKLHYKLPHEIVNDPIRRLVRILKSGINHLPKLTDDQYNEYYQDLDWIFDYFIMNENQIKILNELIKFYKTEKISIPIFQIIQLISEFQIEILNIKSSKFLKESTPISDFARYCILIRHSIFSKFNGSRKDLILFWNEIWNEWISLSHDERSKKMISSNGIHRSWADDDEFRLFIESSDESTEDIDWFNNDSTIIEFNSSSNGLELIKESESEDLEESESPEPESKDSVLSNFTNTNALYALESSGPKLGYEGIVEVDEHHDLLNNCNDKHFENIDNNQTTIDNHENVVSDGETLNNDTNVIDIENCNVTGDVVKINATENEGFHNDIVNAETLNGIELLNNEDINANNHIQKNILNNESILIADEVEKNEGLQIIDADDPNYLDKNDDSISKEFENADGAINNTISCQTEKVQNNTNSEIQEHLNEGEDNEEAIDNTNSETLSTINDHQPANEIAYTERKKGLTGAENNITVDVPKHKHEQEKLESHENFSNELDTNSTLNISDNFLHGDTINKENIELFLPDEHLIGHVPGKLMLDVFDNNKSDKETTVDHRKEIRNYQEDTANELDDITSSVNNVNNINDIKRVSKDTIIDEENESFDSLIFKQPGALTAMLDSPSSSSYTSSPTQSDLEIDLDIDDLNMSTFKLKTVKSRTETIPAKIDMFEKLSGNVSTVKHQRHLNQFNKINGTNNTNDVQVKRKLKPIVKRTDSITILELKELIENKPELITLKKVKNLEDENGRESNSINSNSNNTNNNNNSNNSNMVKKGRSISEIFSALLDDNMKDLSLSAEYKNKIVRPEDLYNRVKIKSDKSWYELSRKTKERYYGAFLRKYNNLIEGDNFKNLDLNDILEIVKVCADFGDIKHKIIEYAVNLIDLEGDDNSSISSSIRLSRNSSMKSIKEDE